MSMFRVQREALKKLYPDAYGEKRFSILGNPIEDISLTERQKTIVKLESKLGRSVRDITLTQLIKEDPNGNLVEKPIIENLNLSQGGLDSLLKTKVESLVIDGATFDSEVANNLINVHDMSDTEKMDVPVTSMKDFIVHKGYVEGSARQDSAGDTGKVSLDVSTEDKIRFMEIPIKEMHIRFKRWNYIEDTLRKSGAAMMHNYLTDIIKQYVTGATAAETFDTTLYKTILKVRKARKKAGFRSNAIIINPTAEETLLNDDKFIDANKLDREGRIVRSGQIGRIFDLDVYAPVTETIETDVSGIFLSADLSRAMHVGMALPLTIANWDDPLRGLTHAILTMHYDLKEGPSGTIGQGNMV